ncbi:MAG: electron transfer flavoprotein subunit alpha/FixB family protein [Burkholderiales bacterium]
MSVLVIIECVNGAPAAASLEHLATARRLALGGPVIALVFGAVPSVAEMLIARGADNVYAGTASDYADYNSDIWVASAARVAKETGVTVIIAAHTPQGADLAPRLAFRLQAGCATGCVSIENSDGPLHFTRPCYGGNVRETLRFNTAIAVATLRAGTCDALPMDASRRGEIMDLGAVPSTRIRRVERRRDAAGAQRLEDARAIVAGGRGLNGPDGFKVLEPLAETLGGAVGASRVPCDLGWCSHAMQIGLTGKTVTPDLYIAVGISGASHHLAGCGNAKTIVAINTDAEAAIFRDAKFGVVGDYAKVVPALTAAIKALPPVM